MYTQFFGNYLLGKGVITSEQLIDALKAQSSAHVKLGALAIHAGYMSASEVEHVFILQTHEDKRFGEIAVEQGYLTPDQVETLLEQQAPDFILLGQILVERGVITPTQLEELVADYQSEFEIYDLEMNQEQKELVEHLLTSLEHSEGVNSNDYMIKYLTLLFNNLIRFIGEDFTPLSLIEMPEIPVNYCTSQRLESSIFVVESALDLDPQTAIGFASRYIGEELEEFDEYAKASMDDFLNLHNGLFSVNMSNEYSLEVNLTPPAVFDQAMFATGKISYLIPIMYPFGTLHVILSPLLEP